MINCMLILSMAALHKDYCSTLSDQFVKILNSQSTKQRLGKALQFYLKSAADWGILCLRPTDCIKNVTHLYFFIKLEHFMI